MLLAVLVFTLGVEGNQRKGVKFPKAEVETTESVLSAVVAVRKKKSAALAMASRRKQDDNDDGSSKIQKERQFYQSLLKKTPTFPKVKPALATIADGDTESLNQALRYSPRVFNMASPNWYHIYPDPTSDEKPYRGKTSEHYDAQWVVDLTEGGSTQFVPRVTLHGFHEKLNTEVFEEKEANLVNELVATIEAQLFPSSPVQSQDGSETCGGGGEGSCGATVVPGVAETRIQGVVLDWGPLELTKLSLQTGAERVLTALRAMLKRRVSPALGKPPVVMLEITASYLDLGPKELAWLAPLVDHMIIACQESVDMERHQFQSPVDWLAVVLSELKVDEWHKGGVLTGVSGAAARADGERKKSVEEAIHSQPAQGKFLPTINFGGLMGMYSQAKEFQPVSGKQYLEILEKRSPTLVWDEDAKEHLIEEVYVPGKGPVNVYYPTRASLLHKLSLFEAWGCGINVMGLSQGLDLFYYQF